MKRLHLLASALLVGSAGCGSGLPDPPAPWVAFHEGGGALASMDTSRLSVRDGVADVWLRFDFVQPDSMEGGEPFHRVDVHQRITCAAERVDDIVMEIRDTTGRLIDRGPGTRWHTFREHPFGQYVFPALCKRLPKLAR